MSEMWKKCYAVVSEHSENWFAFALTTGDFCLVLPHCSAPLVVSHSIPGSLLHSTAPSPIGWIAGFW